MAGPIGPMSSCTGRALSNRWWPRARLAASALDAAADVVCRRVHEGPLCSRACGIELLRSRWARRGSHPSDHALRGVAVVALSGAAAGCAYTLHVGSLCCEEARSQVGTKGAVEKVTKKGGTCDTAACETWGAHPSDLVFEGNILRKRFQSGGRGSREAERLSFFSTNPDWRPYVPRFFGLKTDSQGDQWILMESLTAGMAKPVVLDLKIGTRNFSPGATDNKKRKQTEKAARTTTGSLGLCLTGCKIPCENYDLDTADLLGTRPGRQVTAEELPFVLQRFLVTEARVRHARHFVAALLSLFQTQADYSFFGSSLLLVYDAALGDNAPLRISMVDFCHVHTMDEMQAEAESEGRLGTFVPRDFSYVFGLTTLIEIFDGLLFRQRNEPPSPPGMHRSASMDRVLQRPSMLRTHGEGPTQLASVAA